MPSFNIAFFGSGPFAVPVLERLKKITDENDQVELVEVVSRPGRPSGRGKKIRPMPVEKRAQELGISVSTPESANDAKFLDHLRSLEPDLFLVADYGEFLKKEFRELPRVGSYNLHGSVLPKYRGAAPVARAILNQESTSGVTLFRIVKEMDGGPVVAEIETPIAEQESAGELEERISFLAADLFEQQLDSFIDGSFKEIPQDESLACPAPKLSKEDGHLNWSESAQSLKARIHAMNPWPVARSNFKKVQDQDPKEVLRILKAVTLPVEEKDSDVSSGTVIRVSSDGVDVACLEGTLRLLVLQRAGKKALAIQDFIRGFSIEEGDQFVNELND